MAKRRWNLSEQHPFEASSWGWEFFPVLVLTKPLREKAILCNDASLGEVTTDFSVHLLWCLKSPPFYGACWLCPPFYGAGDFLDMSALQRWTSSNSGLKYGNTMAGYVCTSTLDLMKLWALKWKYYGWTTAPTNSIFLIFGFQLLKFSNRFCWLWKDVCYLRIASAMTLRFTVSLDVQ